MKDDLKIKLYESIQRVLNGTSFKSDELDNFKKSNVSEDDMKLIVKVLSSINAKAAIIKEYHSGIYPITVIPTEYFVPLTNKAYSMLVDSNSTSDILLYFTDTLGLSTDLALSIIGEAVDSYKMSTLSEESIIEIGQAYMKAVEATKSKTN